MNFIQQQITIPTYSVFCSGKTVSPRTVAGLPSHPFRLSRINAGFDRHTRPNLGSASGLRLDYHCSVHELQSLPHTDQSQTTTAQGLLLVKPRSRIAYRQMDLVGAYPLIPP
jgi:hypothetical protein